jgi:hypothetical protein
MKKLLRIAVIAAVTVMGVVIPSVAFAASNLPAPHSRLRYPSGAEGTGDMPIRNSSGQIVGYYRMLADYYAEGGTYTMEFTVWVKDTVANGRGVVIRPMVKFGTNSSLEVGKFKGGSNTWYSYGSIFTHPPTPAWALDVDHGEDWAGVPYQYTGHYNRYQSLSGSPPNWPYFA